MSNEFDGLSPEPGSEVEWEDLLLRLEMMPRALRFVLEEPRAGSEVVDRILDELVEREERTSELLERAAAENEGHGASFADGTQVVILHADKLDRFIRGRVRNFAMVQRRGIDVWNWSVPAGGGKTITVYQLFAHLAQSDIALLANLRGDADRLGGC